MNQHHEGFTAFARLLGRDVDPAHPAVTWGLQPLLRFLLTVALGPAAAGGDLSCHDNPRGGRSSSTKSSTTTRSNNNGTDRNKIGDQRPKEACSSKLLRSGSGLGGAAAAAALFAWFLAWSFGHKRDIRALTFHQQPLLVGLLLTGMAFVVVWFGGFFRASRGLG
jgi:hypothetical protein